VAEITCSRGSQLGIPPFSTVVRGRWPGGIVEIFAPTFFNEARARGFPECVCRFNHSDAMPPLASIAGRTLALTVDGIGLDYVAELPESRMDVYESVERGDISGSSFAFTVEDEGQEWSYRDGNTLRTPVSGAVLYDVAPVTHGAYASADVALRSLARHMDAPLTDVQRLAESRELSRFFARSDRSLQTTRNGRAALLETLAMKYPEVRKTKSGRLALMELDAMKPRSGMQALAELEAMRTGWEA
jgi:uncharacterized protein